MSTEDPSRTQPVRRLSSWPIRGPDPVTSLESFRSPTDVSPRFSAGTMKREALDLKLLEAANQEWLPMMSSERLPSSRENVHQSLPGKLGTDFYRKPSVRMIMFPVWVLFYYFLVLLLTLRWETVLTIMMTQHEKSHKSDGGPEKKREK